jgi:cytochrome c oxidase cbb3-type subunit III
MFQSKTFAKVACLVAAAVAIVAAQQPAGQGTPARPPAERRPAGNSFMISRAVPDPAAVERGQKIFVASCGFCHGARANGGETGPDLVRSPIALDDDEGNLIGPIILKGRPDKGMPPVPLTAAQIKDVAAFLRARQQEAINRGSYKILNVVTGDPKKGEAYFTGTGKCNACHSPTGDLAGVAKRFDPVALQARFLYPQTRMRRGAAATASKPVEVTVTQSNGSTVAGRLEYLDEFNVALRDASGEYHSFTRDNGLKVEVRDPLAIHEQLLQHYSDADMHNILAYLETLK